MLASPCVGICRLDPDTGWCLGCARDAGELTDWSILSEHARAVVWRDLPRRKQRLGLSFRLLPWGPEAALDRLAELAAQPGAVWSLGVLGAAAEFAARPGNSIAVWRQPGGLLLRTQGGRLWCRMHPGLRVFERVGRDGRVSGLVLSLHRSRLMAAIRGIADLGVDADALDVAAVGQRLFDLGLGLPTIRFAVRTGDGELVQLLNDSAGMALFGPDRRLAARLVAASPTRVVLAPLGRIEVDGPIGALPAAGPSTRLLPPHLCEGRELEPRLELPEGYAPLFGLTLSGHAV